MRRPRPTFATPPRRRRPPASPSPRDLIALQRHAGNRAVAQLLRPGQRITVQRWDVAAAKKDHGPLVTGILAKIPGWGKEHDLAELAAVTESPEQLKKLLDAGLGVRLIKDASVAHSPGAVARLVDVIPPQFRTDIIDKVTRYKAHLAYPAPSTTMAEYLSTNPGRALKALADTAHDRGEGLLTDAGGRIARQELTDKSDVVQNAVKALDRGELPSGGAFENRQGRLPGARGAGGYTEYDVPPEPGVEDRGARRFVVNNRTKFLYYTTDHYLTFVRIR